jgi:undecaprenyl-phosphate galactose phosphotransferase/putative colanic acid biosynthesis UDP-glucose lipid carrier transferase
MLMHTEYSELINNYLCGIMPSLNFWLAQVNGFRGETKELIDMKDRVDYDMAHRKLSMLLDLKVTLSNV